MMQSKNEEKDESYSEDETYSLTSTEEDTFNFLSEYNDILKILHLFEEPEKQYFNKTQLKKWLNDMNEENLDKIIYYFNDSNNIQSHKLVSVKQLMYLFNHPDTKCINNISNNKKLNNKNIKKNKYKLIMKYLPLNITEYDLIILLTEYGVVTSLNIARDEVKKYSYAFVRFASQDITKKVHKSLNGMTPFGKKIETKITKEKGGLLYVKNLPKQMDEDHIKELFSSFGDIEYCNIVCCKTLNYAYIKYYMDEDSVSCFYHFKYRNIKLNSSKKIKVYFADWELPTIKTNNNESKIKENKIFKEFFYKNFDCGQNTKEYYTKLLNNKCNNFKLFININEKYLIKLGFNKIEIKYLMNKISKYKNEYNEFINWLNSLNMYKKYDNIFIENGIYNFDIFYYKIGNNIKYLLNIIGYDNDKVNDGKLMISNISKVVKLNRNNI